MRKFRPDELPEETSEVLQYATTVVQFVTEVLCQLFPERREALVKAYRWWIGDADVMSPVGGCMTLSQRTGFLRYYLLEPTVKVVEFLRGLAEDTVFDTDNLGQQGGEGNCKESLE